MRIVVALGGNALLKRGEPMIAVLALADLAKDLRVIMATGRKWEAEGRLRRDVPSPLPHKPALLGLTSAAAVECGGNGLHHAFSVAIPMAGSVAFLASDGGLTI